jgi:hypothetical protein
MKTTILHDEHGKILSVSKVGDLKAAGGNLGMFTMFTERCKSFPTDEAVIVEVRTPLLKTS